MHHRLYTGDLGTEQIRHPLKKSQIGAGIVKQSTALRYGSANQTHDTGHVSSVHNGAAQLGRGVAPSYPYAGFAELVMTRLLNHNRLLRTQNMCVNVTLPRKAASQLASELPCTGNSD